MVCSLRNYWGIIERWLLGYTVVIYSTMATFLSALHTFIKHIFIINATRNLHEATTFSTRPLSRIQLPAHHPLLLVTPQSTENQIPQSVINTKERGYTYHECVLCSTIFRHAPNISCSLREAEFICCRECWRRSFCLFITCDDTSSEILIMFWYWFSILSRILPHNMLLFYYFINLWHVTGQTASCCDHHMLDCHAHVCPSNAGHSVIP